VDENVHGNGLRVHDRPEELGGRLEPIFRMEFGRAIDGASKPGHTAFLRDPWNMRCKKVCGERIVPTGIPMIGAAGEEDVEENSSGVNVPEDIIAPAEVEKLGRDVRPRTHEGSRRIGRYPRSFGKAKINKDDVPTPHLNDIRGADVSVEDAHLMQMVERCKDTKGDVL
jgi:hypothetical protein